MRGFEVDFFMINYTLFVTKKSREFFANPGFFALRIFHRTFGGALDVRENAPNNPR